MVAHIMHITPPRRVHGEAAKAIRRAKNLRLSDVARDSQITPGHLCNVEAGRKTLSEVKARLLAAALGEAFTAITYPVTVVTLTVTEEAAA